MRSEEGGGRDVRRRRDGEESEDLLGVLEETETLQFIGRDFLNLILPLIVGNPVAGSEDGSGVVMDEQVTDHLRALGHEETLTTTELLMFQLADKFDLILTDCHRLHGFIESQISQIILFYTDFKCKDTKFLR